MESKKIRVAVLLGGSSNEKEISLDSGRNVMYKLSPQKYDAIPIFVSEKNELFAIDQRLLVRNSTKEIAMALSPAMQVSWHNLPNIADFVFIGLHGAPGENGVVQGALEMLGLPYNGSSVLTSALCMDKFKTAQFLQSEGFDVPQGMLVDKKNWTDNSADVIKKLNEFFNKQFPLIIKPHDDGCSFMVHKVTTDAQLKAALQELFTSGKMHALVEECVVGMELTVGVVGNDTARALPPSQAVATEGILSIQEKFLPGAGENQTPAPLPVSALELVQRTVEQAYERLGCKGYARIDCFYQAAHESKTGKERVIILEVNTLPGMTPATCIFHQAAEIGMRPMDFVDLIVTLGIEEHKKELCVLTADNAINKTVRAKSAAILEQ
jgi:D-alanine-D-alanine ligase